MRIVLVGIHHRTADAALRGRAGFGDDALASAAAALRTLPGVSEAAVVSTCHRTELYVVRGGSAGGGADLAALTAWWAERAELDIAELAPAVVHREQEPAVRHLFRVAAGLDAVAVGETEALGQVRRAYERSRSAGACGPVLHGVFQRAIAAARDAWTPAPGSGGHVVAGRDMSSGSRSLGVLAARRAAETLGGVWGKRVLIVGAGEAVRGAAAWLKAMGPARLWVTSRTPQRAAALCDRLNLRWPAGGPRGFAELPALLAEADLVVTGTAAPHPVIDEAAMAPRDARRCHRPVVIVDLGLPRDVAVGVGRRQNVQVIDVDALNVEPADGGPDASAVERCEQRVAAAASACMHKLMHREVGRLVRTLRQRLQRVADDERARTHRRLLTADPHRLEALLAEHDHRVLNKLLHVPLAQLHGNDGPTSLAFYAAALRRLFALQDHDATPASGDTNAWPDDEPAS